MGGEIKIYECSKCQSIENYEYSTMEGCYKADIRKCRNCGHSKVIRKRIVVQRKVSSNFCLQKTVTEKF